MAYKKWTFKDGETILNAELMNNIQNGIIESGINPDLNVVVFGDSIFDNKAARAMLKSFGCNLRNYAVSGSTISTHVRNRSTLAIEARDLNKTIFTQWDNFCDWVDNGIDGIIDDDSESERRNGDYTFTNPDVIILDGGANDWQNGVPLWKLTNASGTGGSYAAQPYESSMQNPGTFELDNKTNDKLIHRYDPADGEIPTFAVQLERLMYEMSKKFPKSQRFFVKIHRIYQVKFNTTDPFPFNRQFYWPSARNLAYVPDSEPGYACTQDVLYGDYLDSICHKYGFRIIDIYNDSSLSGALTTSNVYLVQNSGAAGSKSDPWYYLTKDSDGKVKVNNSSIRTTSLSSWQTFFNTSGKYRVVNDGTGKKRVSIDSIPVCDIELFDWKGLHPTAVGYEFGYKPQLFQALTHCRKIIDSSGNFDGEYIE